jgi:hypothetical protein
MIQDPSDPKIRPKKGFQVLALMKVKLPILKCVMGGCDIKFWEPLVSRFDFHSICFLYTDDFKNKKIFFLTLYRGGGSPVTNNFMRAKLKLSVFKTDSLEVFFCFEKYFFLKKYFALKRELVFF